MTVRYALFFVLLALAGAVGYFAGQASRASESVVKENLIAYKECLTSGRAFLVKSYDPRKHSAERAFDVLAMQADCARVKDIPTYTPGDMYWLAHVVLAPTLGNGPAAPGQSFARPPGPTIFDSPEP